AAAGAAYRAIASDYEPAPGTALGRFARDRLTDSVFQRAGNDLVVPTDGVHTVGGAGAFPIAQPVLFAAADAVDHSSFWDRPPAVAAFERWLTG
ncbi:MAG TPA: hypothetical protein VHQ65_09265, partial [Thermoanaerobaculia bacterium]|nr:hypothetical protein [Thermoanaerobaculia bacterium]